MSIQYKVLNLLNRFLKPIKQKQLAVFPHVQLSEIHLQNCKLISTRQKMLELFPKNSIGAEIGVDFGGFTKEILQLVQPQKIYLIDVWGSERYNTEKMNFVKDTFKKEIESSQVEIKRGYSTTELPKIPDFTLDWIYIDTDHSYQTTKDELHIASKKVKENGIISGHDFTVGYWAGGVKYGVIEAVYEFCTEQNWELIFLTNEPNDHRSFAIRKIK